jgi:serine/threonine-protein kinase
MAAVEPAGNLHVDTVLAGKYRITRELGRGGMAAVYEAEHVDIGKRVAVKVLAAELTGSAVVIERFAREARAAASVKSPHIVDVYDTGRLEDGRPFIAMELLEGESLYDRMARVRLIDAKSTALIIGQVAKGLTKAHQMGIVHRDLKPENIHLCKGEDGEEIAKILDFGLAKFYAPVKPDEKAARLTREGAVFGTPAYMSPEQVKGHGNVDHRADLWALGCMAYECLTGRPVWNTDQGVAMTFAAIATGRLPVPSEVMPGLPPAFDAWFQKALQRDPDRRFQTAKELADELAVALGAPPISFVNVGGTPSRSDFEASPSPVSASAPASVRTDGPPPSSKVRVPSLSPTDLIAPPDRPAPRASSPGLSAGKVLLAVLLTGASAAGAWIGYVRYVRPRLPLAVAVAGPAVPSSASAVASASVSAPVAPPPPPEPPRWATLVEEGQALLAGGDADGAMAKLKEAVDGSGSPVARSLLDDLKLGAAATGSCKLVGLSHPRLAYGGNVGRPAVAATPKGTVVAWTDDHEQPGHDHVYSVLVDAGGRPQSDPRDLTPEADYAMRPSLLSVGDRVALLFWDRSGRDPGVKARWLDADGRIGGMSVAVSAAKPGLSWPAMDRTADGAGFWVAWQNGSETAGGDLFLRRLDAELQPAGPEIRASDYEAERGHASRASVPAVATSPASLLVAYALDRDRQHLVARLRVPAGSPDLLAPRPDARPAHPLGETLPVSEDKVASDYPAIGCVRDACFLVWHELDKGAQAAMIDPVKGTLLWRKRFAPRGGHPAVAVSPDGQAEVAYYEGGRVKVASISRDGIGPATTFAKVTGDQPRPWVAPGRAHGEWVASWLDGEAGHAEAFMARLQCR